MMDANTMDRLSRSLVHASSRRRLIKMVGGAAIASVALASGGHRVAAQAGRLSVPVTFTSEFGSFVGQFEIDQFVFEHGQVLAVGALRGDVTDALGNVVGSVSQHLTLPMLDTSRGTCEILHLGLGPLDLTVLGLHVRLSGIVFDVTAEAGGGVFGDVWCGIANLLDGPSFLGRRLADRLNQLVGAP
jgi:hypothetical protein